jgi:hypothetical protein
VILTTLFLQVQKTLTRLIRTHRHDVMGAPDRGSYVLDPDRNIEPYFIERIYQSGLG